MQSGSAAFHHNSLGRVPCAATNTSRLLCLLKPTGSRRELSVAPSRQLKCPTAICTKYSWLKVLAAGRKEEKTGDELAWECLGARRRRGDLLLVARHRAGLSPARTVSRYLPNAALTHLPRLSCQRHVTRGCGDVAGPGSRAAPNSTLRQRRIGIAAQSATRTFQC